MALEEDHYCPDWDYALVRYGDPEMDGCTCFKSMGSNMTTKDTNPKDAVGTKKWRQYCTVPTTIIWELGVAMLEGARKYGRHNYRVAGVRASVYIDAAKGHIDQWWEGEDIDAESGLSHITKAMASLAVLRDAMINDMVNDDRPPKCNLDRVRTEMQTAVEGIFERFPDAVDPYTELGEQEKNRDEWFDVLSAPMPAGPHTILVNGKECYRGDSTAIQIDELAKLAGLNILDSDMHQLEVRMQGHDKVEFTMTHGNAFTTYDGAAFEVNRIRPNDRIQRGLEEKSLEDRVDDEDDTTVLTKTEAQGSSVGFDDFCKDTDRANSTLAGVAGHKDTDRVPRGARGQGGGI